MRVTLENGQWVVKANWLGADRTVFTGSVFACARFVRDNQ